MTARASIGSSLAAGLIALALFWAPSALRAQESEPDPENAQALFRESAEAYRQGEFERAATLLRRAFELEPAPVLQYNLARALEGMGDLDGAITAYDTYLAGEPDTPDRGAIEARLTTLRQQVAERDEAEAIRAQVEGEGVEERVTDGEPADPPAPPPSGSPSPAGWIVLGIGVAGLGVAFGLGANAEGLNAAADAADDHRQTVALVAEAESYALGANVTFGIAGAIALAGLIWGIVDVATFDGGEVALGPTGVSVRGRF